jgi:hypothetical protein
LSGRQRILAAHLLNQEPYLLGRDVVSCRGNLLLAYGCERDPSPDRRVPSIYAYPISRTRRLVFRGFGIFCGDDRSGGVFLHRREFRLQWTDLGRLKTKPWLPQFLPPLRTARTKDEQRAAGKLLGTIIDWFIGYEQWILHEHGYPMRRGQLSHCERHGRAVCSWHPLYAWQSLADRLTATGGG